MDIRIRRLKLLTALTGLRVNGFRKWHKTMFIISSRNQAWGQSTRYFGTLVLEYRFCSTRRYSVLVLLKSTCTRTRTQVLLKIKILLMSTYEYFTSTSHLKLNKNSSQTNPKSLLQDMEHSVNDSFTICFFYYIEKWFIKYFEIISKLVQLLTSTFNKSAPFLQYHAANCLFCVIVTIMSRDLRIPLTTPRSSQLSPRKHEALKQWWYNVGPTLKTMYQYYYRFN